MNDDKLLQDIRQRLDQHAESLDAETLSRLNRARQRALQQLDHKKRRSFSQQWLPAGGIAVAVLVTSLFLFRAEEMAMVTDGTVDEIDIIASSDNLELYEQLDFYLWLLDEQADAV